ncbi:MAG: hypothetical protein ACREJC_02290, partial [Tepidisphaeraceae bacterium]
MPDRPPTPSGGARTAGLCALACSLLLAAFAVISLSAALTKSATIDEPLCGTAAYVNWFLGDYHNDPDNPPLWKYWAMLPYRSTILKFDPSDPVWQRSLTDSNYTWFWATQVLFMTPGTDGMAFINAERRMLVLLGVFAGALTAFWAYRLGGAPAAVATTTLFALDPTLLAHASLVKNDTAQMLLFVALSMTLWKIGQRATFWNLLGGSLICGLALGTKFSGLIIPPIAIITLSCRALLVRDDWPAFGRTLRSRFRKLLVPLAFGLLVVPVSYGTIWAVYRFRFAPTPDPSVRLDMELVYHSAVQRALLLEYRRVPTSQETAEASKPLAVRCIKFAHEHRLLPEAWLHGFMRIYGAVIANDNYLLGDIRKIGWWYYFLVALPVKTPVATILAAALAVGAAWMLQDSAGLARRTGPSWNWLAVLLPGALYFASGFRTNLNTGVRHMLPILPLAFIAVGVVASQAYRVWPRGVKWSSIVLALALATESLLAWPNYI